MLAFLRFLGALRAALAAAEPAPGRMTPLAFGSGLVSATLLIGAISTFVAPAAADQEGFTFDANAANIFFPLFVFLARVLAVSAVMLLSAWRPARPARPPAG
jgi:hypothetical protein